MRIYQFYESLALTKGGPAHSVSQLCNHLDGLGEEVVWVGTNAQQTEAENGILSPEVSRLSMGNWASRGISYENGEKAGGVIAHSHGIWTMFSHQTTKICQTQKIPLIISPRGMLEPWAMAYRKWKKKIAWHVYQKRGLHRAVALHATAYSEAENIRRLGFTQPIAVIPNGVPQIPRDLITEKQMNRSQGRRQMLFIGRIHLIKGIDSLLNAWSRARPANWELIIAGNDEGGYRKEMEQLVNTLKIEGEVRFVGPQYGEEKDSAYRRADLFILPSYSENFGIVVAEALQYGVPVITTQGTPWEELVTERCGWWVPPEEASLQATIKEATALPADELRNMGKRGQVLVERKYQWGAIADKMQQFYRWVLSDQQGEREEWIV